MKTKLNKKDKEFLEVCKVSGFVLTEVDDRGIRLDRKQSKIAIIIRNKGLSK